MSKVYKKYNSNYTTVDNSIFKEKDMSLKAKGLFCLMWSLPDGWEFSVLGLSRLSKDGKDGTQSAVQELERFHYLKRVKKLNETKFDGYDYLLTDIPLTEKPLTENPSTEKPSAENPSQLNKYINKVNNDKVNNNKKEIYREIIDCLNHECGTNYKHTSKQTQKLIDARLKEGYTVDDFYTVINKKKQEWLNDEKMCKFLRPSTLFGNKFEQYLNQPFNKKKSFKDILNEVEEDGIWQ